MKIAVIAAMTKELNLLLPLLEKHSIVNINDITYHTGIIAGHEIIAVRAGIGKVNAAIATLTLVETFHPSLVVNTGVAGGTGAASVLDVVIPDGIGYHDVWCGPGTEPGQAADCPRLFACPLPDEVVGRLGVRRGVLASGDIFVSKPSEVEHILELYPDAVAVDMESAAIAQVCHIKHVPFVAIRVISDTPGKNDDNFAQYTDFWEDAPERTFDTLRQLLAIL